MNEITKSFELISIKNNHLKTRYEENVFATNDTHVITYENTAPIHPDLFNSMQRLTTHVAAITGMMIFDDNIRVGGFQRQNIGDAQLVTIYAYIILSAANRKKAEDTEPKTTGNMAVRLYIGRDEYPDIDLLLEDLSQCEREANLYISQGKSFAQEKSIKLDNEDMNLLNPAA
ncbi:hypothetical protein [Parabacteroides sp. AM08-6]|uniref:hypothetical protein n=1 Tax=Parabacteroides sp. AM08-6 TaxID=2292053 RepID=UPI000EFEAF05|nr:hypothetical protein [Parabacteroides sp. AM08-6]RHJ81890.1 hypothetical protein DW103_10485 [Parabacteroides sp. AM08-6]